jgi:hypothetical protein
MNAEMANDTNYLAALEEYLDRATVDREWREVLQRSANLVLSSLEAAERARLLEYLGRFSPCSAAFIAKELAEVHALKLYSGKEELADDDIARIRGSYIIPPAGEEEGKRHSDTPKEVIVAALRREQGDDPVHRVRVQNSFEATLKSFGEDRPQVEALFALWPVCAVAFTIRVWMWLSDDRKREQLAGAQFREWRDTGDERVWWQYFDVDDAKPAIAPERGEGAD